MFFAEASIRNYLIDFRFAKRTYSLYYEGDEPVSRTYFSDKLPKGKAWHWTEYIRNWLGTFHGVRSTKYASLGHNDNWKKRALRSEAAAMAATTAVQAIG